jgi:hypothetical protein
MPLKPWHKVVTPREDLREGKPLDAAEIRGTSPIIKRGRDMRDAREIDSRMKHIWLKVVKKEYDNGRVLEESNLHS